MPMTAEMQVASFETILKAVLVPAVTQGRAELKAEAYPCAEPATYDEAIRARYRPVKIGSEWGPKWSTCWFRLSGPVPAGMRGKRLALRFATDTEAQLWIDGAPHQGLDVNRDLAELPASLARSGRVTLHVEAACNHPFGADGLQWDSPETHRRWTGPTPGRFLAGELVVVDETVRRLCGAWGMAAQLARELIPPPPPMVTFSQKFPENLAWQDGRAEELLLALRGAWRLIDPADVGAGAGAALRVLERALDSGPAASTTICHAVGHAHIDTAWLWPLRETRRKCLRTFSNVLRLMEKYPDFRFLCSQAQQYAYVEEDAPGLFRQIARRVKEGRWEPGGGMWIEPDCNVPSGESLVRQVLHGVGYWRDRFGAAGAQRFLYLPDTFGFPPCLPQIMRLSGLETFITNKMAWNDTSPTPETTFLWRGLGGAEVVAHFTPGHDYNATNSARELRRGEVNHHTRQIAGMESPASSRGEPRREGARWLQPFGFGDGGGGPTDWMIENARHAANCDGLPRVRMSTASAFCDALAADIEAHRRRGETVPTWSGELYLELHRGTLTTQAWLKKANRQAEDDLRFAELLLAGSPTSVPAREKKAAMAELDRAWKLLLLNQFHDILPGSSITWVYDDARRDHATIRGIARGLIDAGIARWTSAAETAGMKRPMAIFNPVSTRTAGTVKAGGGRMAASAPGIGVRIIDAGAASGPGSVRVKADERRRRAVLENDRVRAEIDGLGQVISLRVKSEGGGESDAGPEMARRGRPLNQLVLHDDRPRLWDAWDIDESHAWKASVQVREAKAWRVVEEGPIRSAVEVTRPVGRASTITQTISLEHGARRLEIASRVEWREEHQLLKAAFPSVVRAEAASFQTQFGRLTRPTHVNTARERTAFEGSVQRWMDVSNEQFGLAVLNESKFGAAARSDEQGVVMTLSLLRSPTYPDPTADRGTHEFAYALLPHEGSAAWANLDEEAEALHRPLVGVPLTADRGRREGRMILGEWAPVELESNAPAYVQVAALKPAESGEGVIVRLVETAGQPDEAVIRWNIPAARVTPVDLLERPIDLEGFSHRAGRGSAAPTTRMAMTPFHIVTLWARP